MPSDRSTPRGHQTRAALVDAIARRPGITEGELVKRIAKSKGTIRNILGIMRERNLVQTKRAPSKGRGPGPLEYSLKLRGRRTADSIVEDLEANLGQPGARRSARSVYVFVRRGTNAAALTKDGRILRVTASAVDAHLEGAKRQLGKEAVALSLSDFLRTFYPEGKVDL